MSGVDFEALDRALSKLRTSLSYCGSDIAERDPALDEIFRSAAIQAFEFTYELGHKVLRRYLTETAPSADAIIELSFSELIRKGNSRAVLRSDWRTWHEFRRLRNLTSRTYSESCAAEVFAAIPRFVEEISYMLTAMRKDPPP